MCCHSSVAAISRMVIAGNSHPATVCLAAQVNCCPEHALPSCSSPGQQQQRWCSGLLAAWSRLANCCEQQQHGWRQHACSSFVAAQASQCWQLLWGRNGSSTAIPLFSALRGAVSVTSKKRCWHWCSSPVGSVWQYGSNSTPTAPLLYAVLLGNRTTPDPPAAVGLSRRALSRADMKTGL